MDYKNKKIAIIGSGIEGKDAEDFFLAKGAEVVILDHKDSEDYLGGLKDFDLIVRSPGVYPFKKELVEAVDSGIQITTPTKIFFDEFKGQIIGITGTKGKGTTSTLIYEILRKSGKDVYLAGNIGKPVLGLLSQLTTDSIVVLEMSSFQLIDLSASPHIAVVLNVTSDHMDWHKDNKEYLEAKKNIVKYQNSSDWAVINSEYDSSKSFSKETKANIAFFSKGELDSEYKNDLTLRGEHNLENIAAAVKVAETLDIKKEIIKDVVKNFKGLEHRLEFVGEVNGIKFYNDSFATGPQPTIAAIKSFTEPITIILGGSDKGLDYKELGEVINKTENIKNIILIGEIRAEIKKHLNIESGFEVYDLESKSMDEIVKKSLEVTPSGGVILLSPAAASFDMFKDYKDRGNQFKEEVKKI